MAISRTDNDYVVPENFYPLSWHVERSDWSDRSLRTGIATLKKANEKLYNEITCRGKASRSNGMQLFFRADLEEVLKKAGVLKARYQFLGEQGQKKVRQKITEVREKMEDPLQNPAVPVENYEKLSLEQRMMLMEQMVQEYENGATEINKLIFRYFNCTPAQFFKMLHREPVLLGMWAEGVNNAKIAWATSVEMQVMRTIVEKVSLRSKRTETIHYEYRTKIVGDHIEREMVEKSRTAIIEEIMPDIPTLIMAQKIIDNIKLLSQDVETMKALTGIDKLPTKDELAQMEKDLVEEYLKKTSQEDLPQM